MKSLRHWTATYILARIREIAYQRQYPDLPWLTPGANEFLNSYIMPTDFGLEFGSGRSTTWFASRVEKLVSVEHDKDWHAKVSASLVQKKLENVEYHHLKGDVHDPITMELAIRAITDQFESDIFDFVLVDAVYRDICTREALRLVRPGGILVIDNVNRHLPSNSTSPQSRSFEMGPEEGAWTHNAAALKSWRCHWTSSGVTDTAIFFKPAHELHSYHRHL